MPPNYTLVVMLSAEIYKHKPHFNLASPGSSASTEWRGDVSPARSRFSRMMSSRFRFLTILNSSPWFSKGYRKMSFKKSFTKLYDFFPL